MAFVIVNMETGRIVGPQIGYAATEEWCNKIETKGKHVAPVQFNDATSRAVFKIMSMGKTVWNNGKHAHSVPIE